MLTLTYSAARLFDIKHPLVEMRVLSIPRVVYIYQLVSVYEIGDNLTIVFVGFSIHAAERVFRMAVQRQGEGRAVLPIASAEVSTPAARPHGDAGVATDLALPPLAFAL